MPNVFSGYPAFTDDPGHPTAFLPGVSAVSPGVVALNPDDVGIWTDRADHLWRGRNRPHDNRRIGAFHDHTLSLPVAWYPAFDHHAATLDLHVMAFDPYFAGNTDDPSPLFPDIAAILPAVVSLFPDMCR